MHPLAPPLLLTLLGAPLLLGACQDSFADCESSGTCGPDGTAGGEGGTTPGDGDGDTGGTGGTTPGDGDGDTGGTGGTNSPCDACTGDTPACNAAEECVKCTDADTRACDGTDTPVCVEEACVECGESADCTDPSASVCQSGTCTSCTSNDDCTHLSGNGVCDAGAGTCVECLDETDCGGNVCDPDTKQCTTLEAGAEFACEACEYDAQCASGHVCVEMSYDDPSEGVVGSFCLWEKDADELGAPNGSCGLNSRPYSQQAAITTVGGIAATVCRPRTTTCIAVLQHTQEVTGCESAGDDTACGAPGFNDGRCREDSGGNVECSYPCLANEDCQAGSTCPPAGDRFCSL